MADVEIHVVAFIEIPVIHNLRVKGEFVTLHFDMDFNKIFAYVCCSCYVKILNFNFNDELVFVMRYKFFL